MSQMGTSALLAPGPTGPVSTARFEMLREGAQECEARVVLDAALGNPVTRGKLGEALVKRCEQILKERDAAFRWVCRGGWSRPEGWEWYEASGWEDRAHALFTCAGDVSRVLKK
jgi:hypothetical protein